METKNGVSQPELTQSAARRTLGDPAIRMRNYQGSGRTSYVPLQQVKVCALAISAGTPSVFVTAGRKA